MQKLLAMDRDIISATDFPALLKESVEVKEKVVTEDPKEKGMRKSYFQFLSANIPKASITSPRLQ